MNILKGLRREVEFLHITEQEKTDTGDMLYR